MELGPWVGLISIRMKEGKTMNWERLFNSKRNKRLFYTLACIVVFVTTYMLVLPALTIDEQTAIDDPAIDNSTLNQEEATINELETVADPFEIEQEREAALNGSEDGNTEESDTITVVEVTEQEETEEPVDFSETEQNSDLLYFYDDSTSITVYVEAPLSAFPEGTYMVVTPINSNDVLDAVNNTLDNSNVKRVEAVDITFYDKDGNEIEPLTEIKVSLVSDLIKDSKETTVVHIDDEGEGKIVEQSDEETKDDEVKFESKDFSTYVVVETGEVTVDYLSADGNTYAITVEFSEDAGIPEGSTLVVEEISSRSKEYDSYVSKAEAQLEEGKVRAAKVFDISIMNGGEEIEPQGPVNVTIEYKDVQKVTDMNDVAAVHFSGNSTEILDVEYTNSDQKLESVSFSTDSFSIYAVIIIDKEEGQFVVEDENYKVTISYTKEANIPMGTELVVEEIDPNNDRYWELRKETIENINEGIKWEDTELTPDPRKGITDAIFFDISLINNGIEIEPDVPLQVKIEYKNGGILVPYNETTDVIHFAKSGTETIEDVYVQYEEAENGKDKIAISYEYKQNSFSEVGSYSTGDYIEISNLIQPSAGILVAPALRAAGDTSISAEKTITDVDKDGVYELALTVTGQSEQSSTTKVNKSNVVIVVDVSGSMTSNQTYTKYTGAGTTSGTYYGVNNGNYFEVQWRNSSWQYQSYGRWYNYNGDVYFRETRLAAEKRALKELTSALLNNNKDEIKDGVDLSDIVEITLVKFAYAQDAWGYSGNDYVHFNGTEPLIQKAKKSSEIDDVIDNLWAGGGTNWERALQVAKSEADDFKTSQTDEPVSIIFITDGVPTSWGTTNTAGSENVTNTHSAWNAASDDANSLVSNGYTLYNIFAFGTDTTKYNNDGNRTDADYLRSLTNYAYSGTGTYANTTLSTAARPYFFNAGDTSALQDAFNAIINSINGNVGYGGVMVDDGVTTGVTNTSVTVDGTVNTEKFRYSIKNGSTTLATVHFDGNNATFTINGTDYPATGETVTTVINGTTHTNSVFSVTVGDKTYKMSPASFDNNGKIQWDLAGIGIIENGYTYELAFDVWPNQLAYDMVADLNNGVKTLEEIKADVIARQGQAAWDQIEAALVPLGNGKYSVRTNYEQYVDYYTVETETNEQTGETTTTYTAQPRKELGPKDPVALTISTMDLRKLWEDSLDQDQLDEILWSDYPKNTVSSEYQVKLHIWKADTLDQLNTLVETYSEPINGSYAQADEHDYLSKTIGWNGTEYSWVNSLEVAPGTMIELSKAESMGIDVTKHTQVIYGEKTYVVLESGHYYTVTEENIERHFELNTIVYHPMLVDGVLSNVTFNADGTVEKIVPMSTVDATNTLKGGINVLKRAFDGDTEILATDDVFTVKITLKDKNNNPYTDFDYRIYYGNNNPKYADTDKYPKHRTGHIFGTTKSTDNTTEFTSDSEPGEAQHTILNNSTGVITIDLFIGDTVRIINVPAGVSYTVEETAVNGIPLSGGAAGNYVYNTVTYEISEGSSNNFVEDTEEIHSVKGNSSSQATVYNKIPTQKIGVKKIGDGDKTNTLSGVTFKLYKDEGLTNQITKDALGNTIGTDGVLTTGSDGTVEIGTLLAGDYYLVETSLGDNNGYNMLADPVKIKVNNDNTVSYDRRVSYIQSDYLPSTSDSNHVDGAGLLIQELEDETGLTYYYYTVTVNNNSGTVLPHTGGPGTSRYILLGSMLITGSLLYEYSLRRRKRKEVK